MLHPDGQTETSCSDVADCESCPDPNPHLKSQASVYPGLKWALPLPTCVFQFDSLTTAEGKEDNWVFCTSVYISFSLSCSSVDISTTDSAPLLSVPVMLKCNHISDKLPPNLTHPFFIYILGFTGLSCRSTFALSLSKAAFNYSIKILTPASLRLYQRMCSSTSFTVAFSLLNFSTNMFYIKTAV